LTIGRKSCSTKKRSKAKGSALIADHRTPSRYSSSLPRPDDGGYAHGGERG
jgi:hypothetical protein